MTPLMTAAVAGHVHLVEFFSSLPQATRMDKIEANELLGATHLDKKHDLSKAIHFWRKAIELRLVIVSWCIYRLLLLAHRALCCLV